VPEWQLFIDESGNLDEPDELAVVAGILVRVDDPHRLANALRDEIDAAYPGAMFPPHATQLHHGTGLLASVYRQNRHDEAHLPEPIGEARRALEQSGLPAAQRVVAAIKAAREPELADLKACDAWLDAEAPALALRLRELCRSGARAFANIIAALPELADGDARLVAAAGYGPVSSDVEDTVALSTDRQIARVDRYLSLLTALFERVLLLLRGGKPGGHIVRPIVASRHVHRPGLPPTPLMPRDIGHRVERAVTLPYFAASGFGDERVRMHAEATPRYDINVHPGVVLADFIANRLRRKLSERRGDIGWHRIRSYTVQVLGTPIESLAAGLEGCGPLPGIASDGSARSSLRAGLAGAAAGFEGAVRQWQREEALAWLDAVRGAR
jgi:hypothetical protein